MKKLLTRRDILFFFLCFFYFNLDSAAQMVNIQSDLAPDSPSATLIIEIKELSQGSMRIESVALTAGKNLQSFEVGDVFQIVDWSLQAPNFVSSPCEVTPVIDHQSLQVTLEGAVSPTNLQCSFQQIAASPKLYLSASPSSPAAPASSADPKTAYREIAKYLTALQQCTPGEFHAKFPDQEANYKILGKQGGVCEVAIDTGPSNLPLTCHFSTNDLALLTSSAMIKSYAEGNVSAETSGFSRNIMNARCAAGLKKGKA